jgi:DNA-binding beta-propeller fold protein YncE
MRSKFLSLFLGAVLLVSCSGKKQPEWTFREQIQLDDIAPIGIIAESKNLWLSDPGNNRMVKTSLQGKIIEQYSGFQRPMHIAGFQSKIYVPEFLTDTIKTISDGKTGVIPLNEKLNAPGGIAVSDNTIAIADFYNHRIVLLRGEMVSTVGKDGHNDGELHYPTDVEIHDNRIYAADAYNNRVQVFDLDGQYVKMIGWKDNINVATGLTVSGERVYVADFYGNRVLVYDLDGNLKQSLNEHLNKPADIYIRDKRMFIANYGAKNVVVYELH